MYVEGQHFGSTNHLKKTVLSAVLNEELRWTLVKTQNQRSQLQKQIKRHQSSWTTRTIFVTCHTRLYNLGFKKCCCFKFSLLWSRSPDNTTTKDWILRTWLCYLWLLDFKVPPVCGPHSWLILMHIVLFSWVTLKYLFYITFNYKGNKHMLVKTLNGWNIYK